MKHSRGRVRVIAAAIGAATVVGLAATPGTAGAAQGTVQEPETHTESSTTVARPDGSRVVTLFTGPMQLRRGAEWVPVDLTLRRDADGTLRPVAAPHDLTLTPTGPVVRFAGGGSAALAPVAPGPLPDPVPAGHRATYPQVTPGHDLVVEATRAGFTASIRRDGDAVGPAPTLALTTTGGAEAVPTPSAGTEAGGTGAGGTGAGGTDSALSRVVAAAPPVGATPTPFDTTVQTTVLRTDLSGYPDLRVGSYDGVAVARSFLSFDLAGIAGAPVTAAVLRIHQDWSSSCRPAGWEVWSSAPVGPATRWVGQPAGERVWASSTETRGHGATCAPGWTEVDVTELVRDWAAADEAGGTILLRAADEADPLGWKRFGSAESPNMPQLEITLS